MTTQDELSMKTGEILHPSWYCPEIDAAIPIDLTPNRNGYAYCKELDYNPHISCHGLQWEFEGRIIRLRRHNKALYGRPSPAMDKFVVVYPRDDKQFPAPRNLVVYNPDGSIHCRPETPTLTTPEDHFPYDDFARKRNFKPFGLSRAFDNVNLNTKAGHVGMHVYLDMGFNGAYEIRQFNPYTGQCEDWLNSVRLY